MNIFDFISLHPFLTTFFIFMIGTIMESIAEKIWCPCKNKDKSKNKEIDA